MFHMEQSSSIPLPCIQEISEPQAINLPYCKSSLARDLVIEAGLGIDETAKALSNGPTLPQDIHVMIQGLQGGVIDCQDSGTALRFLTTYHALHGGAHLFTGSIQLKKRPIFELLNLLSGFGVKITHLENEGEIPYRISSTAPLIFPKVIDATNWHSSQFVSALLLSGVPSRIIYPPNSPSYEYVQLTLQRLQHYGYKYSQTIDYIQLTQNSVAETRIACGKESLQRDWSSAGYWYELLALTPSVAGIKLTDLRSGSGHPDERVAEVYHTYFGVETMQDGGYIQRREDTPTGPVTVDLSQSPDLFLTIACTCLGLMRPFHLTGLTFLPHKESDRIRSFILNAERIGAQGFTYASDTLTWDGTLSPTPSATIDPYRDHRIAMAFAVLCSSGTLPGSYQMKTPEVVSKSYPTFWQELSKLTKQTVEP